MAANQFNFGLRAYYFGMATLAWFIHPWFFMLVTAGVVLILYRREFHSDVLEVMVFTPTSPTESPRNRARCWRDGIMRGPTHIREFE